MNAETLHIDSWTRQLLQQAAQYFLTQGQQAYLVGGSVRNLLLGAPCLDWDITTSGDAVKLARQLANRLHGYYAHLHAKASRVVVKQEGREVVFDIAPLHGQSIEDDLHQRDFTVNAIALPLDNLLQHLEMGAPLRSIDPLQGQIDLKARQLRAVADDVFQRDTLRMLRAIRFMMCYDLTLEVETARMLTRDAGLLLRAAPERIHEELYAILRWDGATERLRLLDSHGLFTTLIPEFIPARGMSQPGLHHWDVFDHSLEAVAALEHLAATLQQESEQIAFSPRAIHGADDLLELRTLLYEAEHQGIFQFSQLTAPPLKLAALLHDIGKPVTYTVDEGGTIRFYHHPQAGVPLAGDIMRRIAASTHDRRLVEQIVANHMRPGQLSSDTLTQRATRRFFLELGPAGIYVALISLSDHLAMRGPQPLTEHWARHLSTVRALLTSYIRERERLMPPRLVQGAELMRHLDLEPGPLIGQLLEKIAEAQAEGLIHSRAEALWFAEEQLQQTK